MTQPTGADVVSRVGSAVANIFGGGGGTAAAGQTGYKTKAGTLKDALATLKQQQPDPDSYAGNAEDFQTDFATWLELYTNTAAAYADQQNADWGYVTLPDGTMIPTGDLSPEQQDLWNKALDAKYANTLNSLGLQQANLIADRRQADFNNAMDRVTTATRIDDQRLRQSEQAINRSISGKGESRSRAQVISDAQIRSAPYATSNGKTSFSANDLGSLLGEYSRFAGVDPNSSLLNYTGITNVDPEGDMARFDQQMGVDGQLPDVASLLAGSDGYQIPDVPDLGAIPQLSAARVNLGSLLQPQQPNQAGVGVASKVGGAINSLLQGLLGQKAAPAAAGDGPPVWAPPSWGGTPQQTPQLQSLLGSVTGRYQ